MKSKEKEFETTLEKIGNKEFTIKEFSQLSGLAEGTCRYYLDFDIRIKSRFGLLKRENSWKLKRVKIYKLKHKRVIKNLTN